MDVHFKLSENRPKFCDLSINTVKVYFIRKGGRNLADDVVA